MSSRPEASGLSARQQETAAQLYQVSRDIVAPVITGFADGLLQEADDQKIIFAARDGIGTYIAASGLLQKFEYPGTGGQDQLKYAFLNRTIVHTSGAAAVGRHLEELGIERGEDLLLADIGMYGTMRYSLEQVIPRAAFRYLISRNSDIPGYADGPDKPPMRSLAQIMSNPAVHFLEDTFSGPMPSPGALIEHNGMLVPNTLYQRYPADIALKRECALRGLADHVASLSERPTQPANEAISRLDGFLLDAANYREMMVPHERISPTHTELIY